MRVWSAFALLCVVLLGAPARAQDEFGVPFVDRFSAVDEERWLVSDGWSNGDWIGNDWRARQVSLRGGALNIVLARVRGGAKRYASGEIQTHGLYRYGYFEVRMQVPRGSGLVSGFFTYTQNGDEATWDEIDVEILGRNTRAVQFTYFNGGERTPVTVPLPFDAAAGMHTYGFEWSENRIRWYVDGVLAHEAAGDGLAIPQRPQRIILNLWNSDELVDWIGPILPWEGPWTLRVACVAQAERYPGRPLCMDG